MIENTKVVILAGGLGTRLSEETVSKPKPMVEIGGMPILWHIMKIYSAYGFSDFVLLLGYKGYLVKEYFYNYFLHQADVTIGLKDQSLEFHNNKTEDWRITLLDTGLETQTGGRIKRAEKFLCDDTFMLTYGDGVSDINMMDLMAFHKGHGKAITMTAVQPEGRYGSLKMADDNNVSRFVEKPVGDGAWINGGFFVCNPEIFNYISAGRDDMIWEREPLEGLARDGELYAYKHDGFWKCMDTLRDKERLEHNWNLKQCPWRVWEK